MTGRQGKIAPRRPVAFENLYISLDLPPPLLYHFIEGSLNFPPLPLQTSPQTERPVFPMKRVSTLLPIACWVLLLLAGCTAPGSAGSGPPALEDNPLFENAEEDVRTFSVTRLAGSLIPEEYLEGEVELYATQDAALVRELMAMFNGWNPEDHDDFGGVDGPPSHAVHFGSEVTILYFYHAGDPYPCLIDNKYYCLPEAFGAYLDDLLAEYEP